jgi:hypothetical protein
VYPALELPPRLEFIDDKIVVLIYYNVDKLRGQQDEMKMRTLQDSGLPVYDSRRG